jgi:hypothetical protein
MKLVVAAIVFSFLSFLQTADSILEGNAGTTTEPPVSGELPISFEPNLGQQNSRVQFIATADAYTAFVMGPEIVFMPKKRVIEAAIRLAFVDANPNPAVEGLEEQQGRRNYFVGADSSKWRTGIPLYGRIRLRQVYPGIDVVFYDQDHQLEYDVILQPGADAKQVKLRFDEASTVRLSAGGDLIVKNRAAEMIHRKPRIFQRIDGREVPVDGGFLINRRNEVSFDLRNFRHEHAVVIDPVITYGSYLGGNREDDGLKIRVDRDGCIYVMGRTASYSDFPRAGSHTEFGAMATVGFITKLTPDGKTLVYTTFFGTQESGAIRFNGFAVDSLGQAYLAGDLKGDDIAIANAYQPARKGPGDAFVAKFDPTGSRLIYSTFLGGTSVATATDSGYDYANDVAVDESGNAYVVGSTTSADFPVKNAFQAVSKAAPGGSTAFVTKINPTGSDLVFSTYLGGSRGYESGDRISVDTAENIYVTGRTNSGDFPVTAGALQTLNSCADCPNPYMTDLFVTKLNPSGSALVFSSFLGGAPKEIGEDETVDAIAVDSASNVYLAAATWTAMGDQCGGHGADPWFVKLDSTGSRQIYSLCEDTMNGAAATGVAVDSSENAYFIRNAVLSNEFAHEAAVIKLGPNGNVVDRQKVGEVSGESLSDIALGAGNLVYVTGKTTSADFPVVGAYQSVNHGGGDAFIAVIDFSPPAPTGAYTRVEQNASDVAYTGFWHTITRRVLSGGSSAASMRAGSRTTLTFSGTAARWIGLKDPWSGVAKVYVDGAFQAQVDTYSASTKTNVVLYDVNGMLPGAHTLTVEVTRTRNPASRGLWIWIDAFDYLR